MNHKEFTESKAYEFFRKRSIAERDRLVTENLDLVYAIVNAVAKRFGKNIKRDDPATYQDLVQDGNYALINAAWNFDETKGAKFTTYAAKCIYHEVRNGLWRIKSPIHIPQSATEDLQDMLGRSYMKYVSIDKCDEDEDDEIRPNRISNLVTCDETDLPDYDILNIECQALYDAALATLNDRERTALEMRLGLNGSDVYSSKEIGEILGVGEERVRQLIKSAKRKLRDYFATLSPAA